MFRCFPVIHFAFIDLNSVANTIFIIIPFLTFLPSMIRSHCREENLQWSKKDISFGVKHEILNLATGRTFGSFKAFLFSNSDFYSTLSSSIDKILNKKIQIGLWLLNSQRAHASQSGGSGCWSAFYSYFSVVSP